jgi:hypothetical protein
LAVAASRAKASTSVFMVGRRSYLRFVFSSSVFGSLIAFFSTVARKESYSNREAEVRLPVGRKYQSAYDARSVSMSETAA